MSAKNKALVQRWFDEVWNRQRVEAIDEMLPAVEGRTKDSKWTPLQIGQNGGDRLTERSGQRAGERQQVTTLEDGADRGRIGQQQPEGHGGDRRGNHRAQSDDTERRPEHTTGSGRCGRSVREGMRNDHAAPRP
jgi:hypothetical protein